MTYFKLQIDYIDRNQGETVYVLSRVVENGFPRSALNNTGKSFCIAFFSEIVLDFFFIYLFQKDVSICVLFYLGARIF